jgi:hypothetical protein
MNSIAWLPTAAASFLLQRVEDRLVPDVELVLERRVAPTTSAISTAVISQATFQLRFDDQKPRAVIQKRRTSGFFCARWIAVSFDMKTLVFPSALNAEFQSTTRPKVPKVQSCRSGRGARSNSRGLGYKNRIAASGGRMLALVVTKPRARCGLPVRGSRRST